MSASEIDEVNKRLREPVVGLSGYLLGVIVEFNQLYKYLAPLSAPDGDLRDQQYELMLVQEYCKRCRDLEAAYKRVYASNFIGQRFKRAQGGSPQRELFNTVIQFIDTQSRDYDPDQPKDTVGMAKSVLESLFEQIPENEVDAMNKFNMFVESLMRDEGFRIALCSMVATYKELSEYRILSGDEWSKSKLGTALPDSILRQGLKAALWGAMSRVVMLIDAIIDKTKTTSLHKVNLDALLHVVKSISFVVKSPKDYKDHSIEFNPVTLLETSKYVAARSPAVGREQVMQFLQWYAEVPRILDRIYLDKVLGAEGKPKSVISPENARMLQAIKGLYEAAKPNLKGFVGEKYSDEIGSIMRKVDALDLKVASTEEPDRSQVATDEYGISVDSMAYNINRYLHGFTPPVSTIWIEDARKLMQYIRDNDIKLTAHSVAVLQKPERPSSTERVIASARETARTVMYRARGRSTSRADDDDDVEPMSPGRALSPPPTATGTKVTYRKQASELVAVGYTLEDILGVPAYELPSPKKSPPPLPARKPTPAELAAPPARARPPVPATRPVMAPKATAAAPVASPAAAAPVIMSTARPGVERSSSSVKELAAQFNQHRPPTPTRSTGSRPPVTRSSDGPSRTLPIEKAPTTPAREPVRGGAQGAVDTTGLESVRDRLAKLREAGLKDSSSGSGPSTKGGRNSSGKKV